MKPHLYINSKGYFVTRHSYSGSESFNFCARKYYLERVQGWSERTDRAARHFGMALEAGVTFWHQHGQDTQAAVAEFVRLWAEHKEKPYVYSKIEKDWDTLNLDGQELIRLYAVRYPTRPYVVKNPRDSFQIQTNFEVFPDTKLAGIEFTSYIDLVAYLKGSDDPIIIDMKTSGTSIPDLVVLDPQLRSYSWVKGWPNVAFEWFRKMGRLISKGDPITFLEPYAGFEVGTDAIVMAKDDFGLWVTTDQAVVDAMEDKFVGESKAVKAARQEYIAANGKHVTTNIITKQRVQFKQAYINQESADDIGRSIKRDVVNIAAATEKEFFPMQSGVRFPNNKCEMCSMRGICADRPDLRDQLLVRKQMDEFDFGSESE